MEIEITGVEGPGGRYLVRVDGIDRWIRPSSMPYMVWLGLTPRAWQYPPDDWPAGLTARYLYRLRQELDRSVTIENNRCGCYRLIADTVRIDRGKLIQCRDARITQLLACM